MNDLIEALEILSKYQKNMWNNFTTIENSAFIANIDNIKKVSNKDFKALQGFEFYAGIPSDAPSDPKENDEFEERLGGRYDDSINDSDIKYLKEHCSNAFFSSKWGNYYALA